MEILTLLIVVAALIAVFELAVVRSGADSRERLGDSPRMRTDGGPF